MRGKFWLIAGALALATGIGAGAAGPASAKEQKNIPAVRTPSDVSLAESVRDVLAKADPVTLGKIDVQASNGVVVLRGFVRSEGERKEAIQDAKKVSGVTAVKDDLTIAESDH